jgi:hypothetical protein
VTAVVGFLLGEINLVAMVSFLERGTFAGRASFLWMRLVIEGKVSLVLRERDERAEWMDEIREGLSLA